MRELHVIENNGLFGITFKSDNKEEANTVMNAIQRFISKVSNNEEIKENINDNSKSSVKDYSRCPIDGPSKDVYLYLFSNKKLIGLYNNDELEQGYKDYIKNELNKRGIFDLSMTKSKKKSSKDNNSKNEEQYKTMIENIKEHEIKNRIEEIKEGRDIMILSDEELEEIALLESELASICEYSETAKHILQGRKFRRQPACGDHSRELENKITKGRRLSELTLEELKELGDCPPSVEKVTMLDNYDDCPPVAKKDIQKEIDKRENKYFEDYMRENKEIISFGEDDEESSYKIDEEDAEDPLSLGVDEDNLNRWDYDADGDKVDSEGNKMLFDY